MASASMRSPEKTHAEREDPEDTVPSARGAEAAEAEAAAGASPVLTAVASGNKIFERRSSSDESGGGPLVPGLAVEEVEGAAEAWDDALEDLREAGFQYRTAGLLKRAAAWGIGFVPFVGSAVNALMKEDHAFVSSRAVPDRSLRATGHADVSNWFASQFFINRDGLAIYWRRWMPPHERSPRAIVVISHGLSEHSQRYEDVAMRLAGEGYAVYALDHQGHGCSEGDRMHVKWFADFVEDLLELTLMAVGSSQRMPRVFLLGHGTGGLIGLYAAHYAPGLYQGIILSSPALHLEMPLFSDVVVPRMAALAPKLPSPGMDHSALCRDNSVVDRYLNDPLVCHGRPTLRLSSEVMAAALRVPAFAAGFSVPYLLMHGSGDRICLPLGSASFHDAVKAVPEEDKEFHIFPGAYHELFNEPDRDSRALACTLDWLEDRLSKLEFQRP
ncbi:Monoglyceride lipase [Hondaea fermentalgiana]|uniref:Monoglyceride lipase n=1 Tax=Hondaea fermentalgiana TaxID=2315210 RepID=A0A2R5GDE3_9STRA|nr:Monoglyceride lipase [Hondaea fermentalgiana]|eukprot:GBG25824.1 Monoglyceride lipase [Hondaea fermentalgiana]